MKHEFLQFNQAGSFHLDLNAIELAFDCSSGVATLAPRQDVLLDPQGGGLGRVLMSLLIVRAKERFSQYPVARATLGWVDAETPQERDRRNSFYRAHGFELDFTEDPEHHRVGAVFATSVGQLQPKTNPDKVRMVPAEEFFLRYREALCQLQDARHQIEGLKNMAEGKSKLHMEAIRLLHVKWAAGVALLFVAMLGARMTWQRAVEHFSR